MKKIPASSRTWESHPLPSPEYLCANCDNPTVPEYLFWVMANLEDANMDDWYCYLCRFGFVELDGAKPIDGICLADAMRSKVKDA